MKTLLLAGALAASAIANVVLLVRAPDSGSSLAREATRSAASTDQPAAPDPQTTTPGKGPGAAGSSTDSTARAPRLATRQTREIMHLLQAQGVPLGTQVAIALALVNQDILEERKGITTRPTTAAWAAGRAGSERNLTPEQRDQLFKLDLKQDDIMAELLGVDYRRELAKERYTKDPRFAGLPLEKLLQLSEMDHERSMADRDQMRAGGNPMARMMTDGRNRKAEREEMLAKVFTPDELARYQLYHSDFALQLQRHLEGSDVSDEQYAAVYREASKAGGDSNNTTLDPVVAALRTQVSPDAALRVVAQSDQQFAPAISIFQRAGIGNDEILRRRGLVKELMGTGSRDRAAELYASVTAGLSPEARAELEKSNYFQQAGRRAASFRPRP